MREAPARAPRTDWPQAGLALLPPLVVAAGFVYLAGLPDWQPTQAWLYGLYALLPLDLVRAIVLAFLGVAYAKNRTPREAAGNFLTAMAVLAVLAFVAALFNLGPVVLFHLLTSPLFYEVAALPVAVLLIDSVVGLKDFRGDRQALARRLDAFAQDLWDWVTLMALRVPLVILPALAVVVIVRSRDVGTQELFARNGDLLRRAGLLYLAVYFLGRGALAAHVHSAQFARIGGRALDVAWLQWLLTFGKKDKRRGDAPPAQAPASVNSVPAIEEEVSRAARQDSDTPPR